MNIFWGINYECNEYDLSYKININDKWQCWNIYYTTVCQFKNLKITRGVHRWEILSSAFQPSIQDLIFFSLYYGLKKLYIELPNISKLRIVLIGIIFKSPEGLISLTTFGDDVAMGSEKVQLSRTNTFIWDDSFVNVFLVLVGILISFWKMKVMDFQKSFTF